MRRRNRMHDCDQCGRSVASLHKVCTPDGLTHRMCGACKGEHAVASGTSREQMRAPLDLAALRNRFTPSQ